MNKVNKNIKEHKQDYYVLDKIAKSVEVKSNMTDAGGNFYVYDLYDSAGTLIALNRYVYRNSDDQPFEELTEDEELILNPHVEPVEEILDGK